MKNCHAREVVHMASLCNLMATKDYLIDRVENGLIYFCDPARINFITIEHKCVLGSLIPASHRETQDRTMMNHCSSCNDNHDRLSVNTKFNTEWLASKLASQAVFASADTRHQLETHELSLIHALMAQHHGRVLRNPTQRAQFRWNREIRLVDYGQQ